MINKLYFTPDDLVTEMHAQTLTPHVQEIETRHMHVIAYGWYVPGFNNNRDVNDHTYGKLSISS